jgi:hypothetical protein
MNNTLLRRFTILVCAAVLTASCHKSTPLAGAEPSDASSASSSSASVAPTAIVQAVPFEGEIELETYPFSLVAMLKGDRSRIEMYSRGSWTGGALLIDPAANEVAAVTSKGSAYSVTDLASQQRVEPASRLVQPTATVAKKTPSARGYAFIERRVRAGPQNATALPRGGEVLLTTSAF